MQNFRAGDPDFFSHAGPFSLVAIASAASGTAGPKNIFLHGLASLSEATPNDVSFINGRKHLQALGESRAGAIVLQAKMLEHAPASACAIVVDSVDESWSALCRLFHPELPVHAGIHPTAIVAESAAIHRSAEIGAYAVIGERVVVGADTRIDAHAVIGPGVVVGVGCCIGSHVSISHARLGDHVNLHPGVRIGQSGFGLASSSHGLSRIPQVGRVIIGNDVEIGANSTIDRGSIQDTIIGDGSQIDNLVQVGHNVRIGRSCVIVAQVGISGSTQLGDFVQVGGQAAMAPHLTIGQGARIGAQAGVIADVPAGAAMIGSPAQPRLQFWRQIAFLKQAAQRSVA